MRKTTLLYFFLFIFQNCFSIIAYPYPITINTPNGETKISLCGNENLKFALTSDGYLLTQNKEEWFFSYINEQGQFVQSSLKAEDKDLRSDTKYSILSTYERYNDVCEIYNQVKIKNIEEYWRTVDKREKEIIGTKRILVVLAQYKDKKFSKTDIDFANLFNSENYTVDNAHGSVYDYYKYVSYGKLDIHCDVIGPFDTKNAMNYYGGNSGLGGNDKNPYALFQEAIEYASTQVNLKDYDSDNDGYIDNIHIIYAGYGEEAGASSDAIWAHEMRFDPIDYKGVKIDRYSCAPELRSNQGNGISRIGPHCHEIGHALGAMDYYDTDYQTNGDYQGTGEWDIMASGSWNNEGISPANFNPYVKAYNFGWVNVINLTEEGEYNSLPTNTTNEIYQIDTPKNGEFFLLENRQKENFDVSVPGHGLLIYHIDSNIERTASNNKINASYPQNCYIVCASSKTKHHTSNANSYGDINSSGCPYPGTNNNHNFNSTSTPSALCNDGSFSNINITDIKEENDCISFLFSKNDIPDQPEDTPVGDIVVWEDSFDNYFLNSRWHQQSTIGNSSWQVKKSFSGNTINSYLLLSPGLSPFDGNNSKVITRLYLSLDDLENDEYILSLISASSGENPNGNIDSLCIFTADAEKESISERIEFGINSSQWNSYTIKMKKDSDTKYVCIEGVCYKGTSLMIDDFAITKHSGTNINNVYHNNSRSTKRYSINGVLAPQNRRGIYIQNGKKIAH